MEREGSQISEAVYVELQKLPPVMENILSFELLGKKGKDEWREEGREREKRWKNSKLY